MANYYSFHFEIDRESQHLIEETAGLFEGIYLEETFQNNVTVSYDSLHSLVDFIYKLAFREGFIEGRAYSEYLVQYGEAAK